MYKALQQCDQKGGRIKEKWELDLQKTINDDEWFKSIKANFIHIRSPFWQEFAWKFHLRFFRTPLFISKYTKNKDMSVCWRKCGEKEVDYLHIFYSCPNMQKFWTEVKSTMKQVFGKEGSYEVENVLLGILPRKMKKEEQYLYWILRITALKQITRNWKTTKLSNIKSWFETIEKIQLMERLTYKLNNREAEFQNKWTQFKLEAN